MQSSNGNSGVDDCSGVYAYHFSQFTMGQHFMAAGTQVCAQFWSRDTGFAYPDNCGLTDALHLDRKSVV